jgi:hypothetical protein
MEIEICTNVEYIREHILVAEWLDESLADDAAEEWSNRAFGAVIGLGLDPVRPGGQRQMYHGWSGTQGWTKRGAGWGTFDDCDKATEQKMDAALHEITNNIHADFRPLPAESE